MLSDLDQSIQYIKSVGPKRAEAFSKAGLCTIRDLLHYFPTKYLDRRNILSTRSIFDFIRSGFNGEVTIIGKVITNEIIRYSRKQLFKVILEDEFNNFECVWFQGVKFFKDSFKESDTFAISGKPVLTKYGNIQFVHPDFDRIDSNESNDFLNTGGIIPVYKLPSELKLKNIGAISIRRIAKTAVEKYYQFIPETLPKSLLEQKALISKSFMIKNLHFPKNHDQLEKALYRLKYEEIFYFEILIALRKNNLLKKSSSNQLKFNKPNMRSFIKSLPFELTKSQLKVLGEIREDIENPSPMNRLLQGDVGSGKTIIAVISILSILENMQQAAFIAPTEILASQHYISIKKYLKSFGYKIHLLTSSTTKKKRETILNDLQSDEPCLLIGTHALFEKNVVFRNLALVVIDEQHRFGVVQRHNLIKKGLLPNVLVMTATPIPRTLTMTIYSDLDVSIINELPKNRKPIKTVVRSENKLKEIYNFIIDRINNGEQAFIVYPLVEESEKLDLKSATEAYNKLVTETFRAL
jgi:ATP-dependent DNA helicase RecG